MFAPNMIVTEHLLIQPYKPEDAESFFNNLIASNDHLVDYFANMVKTNNTLELAQRYLAQKQLDWHQDTSYACGIFLKDDKKLIGHISVREIDWRVPKGELAYFIFKPYTGFNYATEALSAFKNWCFNKKLFNRLFMKIAGDNVPSIKVAERCGFTYEGLLKKDYRRREQDLVDMKIYGYIETLELIRTDSQNSDFAKLIKNLDANLHSRNGDMQEFFNQFNSVENIRHVIVGYLNDIPVGCGALKHYDKEAAEVKRMFVDAAFRGKGIAGKILFELENWAKELDYTQTILETGGLQHEAINLYKKNGYNVIENYGQYEGIDMSICFKKDF